MKTGLQKFGLLVCLLLIAQTGIADWHEAKITRMEPKEEVKMLGNEIEKEPITSLASSNNLSPEFWRSTYPSPLNLS